MATTPTTDLIAASRALDPASRALLNLWLHRGLDDEAIARLSGGSAEEVAARRRHLVERLAAEVGDTPDAVHAALNALAGGEAPAPAPPPPSADAPPPPTTSSALVLPGQPEPEAVHAPEALVVPGDPEPEAVRAPEALVVPGDPEPEAVHAPEALVVAGDPEPEAVHAPEELVVPGDPEPESEPAALYVPPAPVAREERRRPERKPVEVAEPRAVARRSPIPATLGAAVGLVLGLMILIAAITGGSDNSEPAATPAPTPSPAAATPTPRTGPPLAALPGGPPGAKGTLSLSGGRLAIEASGLDEPETTYDVWLFNSVADARRLGRLDEAPFRLPRGARRFRSVDVSLEPGADAIHSGQSVLRAELPR